MRRLLAARMTGPRIAALLALTIAVGSAPAALAIEMFTFFGDGSRIGLPSLEVPIEAYPGIPLRSDRIRARNRALRMRQGVPVPPPPAGSIQPSRGITIRTMPIGEQAPETIPIAPEPQ
ncbi:MAG: hypothetical protein EBS56_01795 [Planctomycetia bacterium]|nr:hypothetical protein [Planctomycetia bacterium]